MPNPTRGEIIEAQLARQWAEWNKSCEVSSPEIQAAANFILAHTTPPTMDEVEWDDNKHYLAEAEHVEWGTVIMLRYERGFERIQVFRTGTPNKFGFASLSSLTPTGRKYELKEIENA